MVQNATDQQAIQASVVASLEELNLRPSQSTSRPAALKSSLTIVNHKNGTRVAIDQEVIKKIGSPECVQIALNHDGIAIGVEFTGDDNYFHLRKAANKAIIYSSPLVNELTEAFELDFTNVSSVSFQDVKYLKIGSRNVAFVKLVRDESEAAVSTSDDDGDLDSDELGTDSGDDSE